MMQPIGFQSRVFQTASSTPGISPSSTISSVPSFALSAPAADAQPGMPQIDFTSLMLPILQLVMQILQTMLSGGLLGAGASTAGNPGTGDTGSDSSGTGTGVSGSGSAPGGTGTPGTTGSTPGASGGYGSGGAGSGPSGTGDTPGTQTPGGGTGDPSSNGLGDAASMTINQRRNMNYSNLKSDPSGGDNYQNVRAGKEAFNGVTGTDAAIMHLGGRGHISAGESPDGVSGSARIYNNVLNHPDQFTPDEVALIKGYAAQEKAKYGYFTGESLDNAFIDQMAKRGDIDPAKVQQYHAAVAARVQKMTSNPDQAKIKQEASQEVNITSDIGTLQQQSGLTPFEQAVYRLSGHATLFSGDGSINGDILAITLGNKNSLDGRDFAGQKTNIDSQTLSLLQDDLASDGKLDGDSLRYANQKVLDKIFLGGPDVTAQDVQQHAIQTGQANGRSQQQIMDSLKTSASDALKQFGDVVTKHPIITAAGAGALAAGAAVCPFLAGTMAVGAGIAAGNKFLAGQTQQAA